jgi:hypothetical protein
LFSSVDEHSVDASDEITTAVFHFLTASSFTDILPFGALLSEVLAA